MNLAATRSLACVQVRLHVLRQQQESLTELQDIKEIRALTGQLDQPLRDAIVRQLVPADPAAHVLAEWNSLRDWSNRFQTALRAADELAAELDAPATNLPPPDGPSKRDKKKAKKNEPKLTANATPSRSQLENWVAQLEAAPPVLRAAAQTAQREHLPALWEGNQPHSALLEVAMSIDRVGEWVLASKPGDWANNIPLPLRPSIASQRVLAEDSDAVTQREALLVERLARAKALLVEHARHAEVLAEAGRLVSQGNPGAASRLTTGLSPEFPDLDYAAIRLSIAGVQRSARERVDDRVGPFVGSVRARSKEVSETASASLIIGPLKHLCEQAAGEGRKLQAELQTACTAPAGSELHRQWQEQMTRLTAALGALERETIPRVQRRVRNVRVVCAALAALAIAGSVWWGFEFKAAAERAAAEAKAAALLETEKRLQWTGVAMRRAGMSEAKVKQALTQGGTVVAWGRNSSGQTTVPAGLSGVVAIAAGYIHTVALKQDGTVVAWGYNMEGQTRVPAGLSGVVAIAAGLGHTVALKQDGTVVAWGDNRDRQTTVPAGLSGVVAIAAGDYHTVALKQDGTVVAWGGNSDGQTTVPAGLSGVVALAAGGWHTVALKQDGTVVAWGYNTSGQTKVPAGLSGVVALAAGYYYTVALKQDGTVVAWGGNSDGQTTVPAGLSGVVAIAAGEYHTVALKQDGTVVAWGGNGYGQTTVPAGLSGVVAIAAGGYHTVALKLD